MQFNNKFHFFLDISIIQLFNTPQYPQNGICKQKYNFWPKNDDEKWSRKIHML